MTSDKSLHDEHFQKHFLAFLLRDTEFLAEVADQIKPEFFSNEYAKGIVTLLLQFWNEHNACPSTLIFREIDKQEQLKPAHRALLSQLADDCFAFVLQNKSYLLSEFDRFVFFRRAETELPDWLDLLRKGKHDEFRAKCLELGNWQPSQKSEDVRPKLVDLEHLPTKCVQWLWPGRIASGKQSLIGGVPGLGKSYLGAWLAAQVSTGRPWPDDANGTTNEPGSVVLLCNEDDYGDTVKPRLLAAGADLSRITGIQGIEYSKGEKQDRMFNLEHDLPALGLAIDYKPNCRLVVIDPISSYCGKTDTHRDAALRGLLTPLGDLAARKNVAIVCIAHLNKNETQNAINRLSGSIALVAASRSAYVITSDKDDEERRRRLFTCVKNNLAQDLDGKAFRLEPWFTNPQYAVVTWEAGSISTTADEALSKDEEDDKSPGAGQTAREWLVSQLLNGPVAVPFLKDESFAAGLSWKTVEKAKSSMKLSAKPYRVNGKNVWFWAKPSHEFGDSPPAQPGAVVTPPPPPPP